MERSSSRRSSRTSRSTVTHKNFVSDRLAPAIRGKSCPICFRDLDDRRAAVITVCMHAYCIDCIRKWSNLKRRCPLCNAEFNSWFFKINLFNNTFHKHRLPVLNEGTTVSIESGHNAQSDRLLDLRVIRRSWEEFNSDSWRTRPSPWRRSFGRPGSVPSDVVAQRVLQWRASIYNRRLQAVPDPSYSRIFLEQNMSRSNGGKERITQRIEPWIQRELQAILGDPDPSVIVHVATSLFISNLEEKLKAPSGHLGVEDNFLAPLRRFLQEQTNMFWHELSCFAESSFSMETYDAVVEYKQLD